MILKKHYLPLVALALPLLAGAGNAAPVSAANAADLTAGYGIARKATPLSAFNLKAAEAETADIYPLNFDKDAKITNSQRWLNGLTFKSADGEQKLTGLTQKTDRKLYAERLDHAFFAKAGEQVQLSFDFSTDWMNGYVYLDRGNDGKFSAEVGADHRPAPGSDLMAYSFYYEGDSDASGWNSNGTELTGGARAVVNPPAFTIPSDLKPGYYRLRCKVDWGNIDPGGDNKDGQGILKNGGSIVDLRLNVHGETAKVSLVNSELGSVRIDGQAGTESGEVPFGKDLTLTITPAKANAVLTAVRVRHGYNLEGDSLVLGTPQYVDVTYPAYLVQYGKITIPGSVVDGDVRITPIFSEAETGASTGEGYYPVNFDKDLTIDNDQRVLKSVRFFPQGGKSTSMTFPADPKKIYNNLTPKAVAVKPGVQVTTNIDYDGHEYMHAYLYIDLNRNGQFSPLLNADGTPAKGGELLAYTYYKGKDSNGADKQYETSGFPTTRSLAFQLPSDLPKGFYRARLKIDWDNIDPAGNTDANQSMQKNAGYIVDFLINAIGDNSPLDIRTTNGSIVGSGNTGMPDAVTPLSAFKFLPVPAASGYATEGITVRHGYNLDGPQTDELGNRQWGEYTLPATATTIAADSVDGELRLTANFVPNGSEEYKLWFSDEFNQPDGSMPDSKKWARSTREHPTWKRFVSTTPEGQALTAFIRDGKLVTRCIPNPLTTEGNVEMISGSIESSSTAYFTYGKVEGRMKTIPHAGNFPAFWMMPKENGGRGWPWNGEIDIWEQIDSQDISHHTIHTGWANGSADGGLGNSNNPPKSGPYNGCKNGQWHTFSLEWDETSLKWYVDGKHVFTYNKLVGNSYALQNGQWPFDKDFYIILNQSVGNGSWAANRDASFTYETLFDWVRVYQKDGQTGTITGLSSVSSDSPSVSVEAGNGSLTLTSAAAAPVSVFDLSGRSVFSGVVSGSKTLSLASGVYVAAGQKVLVK